MDGGEWSAGFLWYPLDGRLVWTLRSREKPLALP
jgi:hypothetical protein